MVQIVLNKYRNELGRKFRKMYDGGGRSAWCRRSAMRAFMPRPDCKSGTIATVVIDNLIMELYAQEAI